MLIYRSAERVDEPRRILDAACAAACAATVPLAAHPSHDDWVELLIEVGELEAAIADAEMPERDDLTPLAGSLRRLTRLLGHAVVRSWDGDAAGVFAGAPAIAHAAREAARLPLPPCVRLRVPEGYAYYGLYPETYAAAARRCAAELRPERAVVIGIRSIGTSLSAVVAATLAESGAAVRSCTVRPRGHPFARTVSFGERLADVVRDARNDWFAVVDEGPGLSGSSMTSVADALLRLGVAEERIVFFPSWLPDPSRLVSDTARTRWPRHRKFVGDFDDLWLRGGRLVDSFGGGAVRDLSAGAWREVVDVEPPPPVHPQHEQRKLLVTPDQAGDRLLLKFVGLGRYGRARLERARRLHADGWVPEPLVLRHGFLARRWVEGAPVAQGRVPAELHEHVARYAAYLRREHPADDDPRVDVLLEMMRTNVRESLGPEWLEALRPVEALAARVRGAPTTRCDARPMPHEWLRTATGFVKTDALSHHDDHFLPGPQHVAWDLAGACAELDLDAHRECALLTAYVAASGDSAVRRIFPFHRVAYLAFRIGYTTLAAQALGDSPDGAAMRGRRAFYAERLARVLRPTDEAA